MKAHYKPRSLLRDNGWQPNKSVRAKPACPLDKEGSFPKNIKQYFSHLAALIFLSLLTNALHAETEADWIVLNQELNTHIEAQDYDSSVTVAREALSIARESLNHTFVADSLYHLATVLDLRGDSFEARPLYYQALDILEKEDKHDLARMAAIINSLALNYQARGEYAKAESLYQRALEILERAEPAAPLEVAKILYGLAENRRLQGIFSEAEELHGKALAIREEILGPDNMDVAKSLYGLAGTLLEQAKYDQAEPLYQKALSVSMYTLEFGHSNKTKILEGFDALHRAIDRPIGLKKDGLREEIEASAAQIAQLNDMAALHAEQSDDEQAEALYKRSLAIADEVFGKDTPILAPALDGLGILYYQDGRYEEAEKLFRRSITLWERCLGSDHPHIASLLTLIAATNQEINQPSAARLQRQRAIKILESHHIPGDSRLLDELIALAVLESQLNDYAAAEALASRSLELQKEELEPDHPNMAKSLNTLARIHIDQSRLDDAENLLVHALKIQENTPNPTTLELAKTLNYIGLLSYRKGAIQQAKIFYERSVRLCEESNSTNNSIYLDSLLNLVNVHDQLQEYKNIILVLERLLATGNSTLRDDTPKLARLLNDLGFAYHMEGDNDKAKAMFSESLQAQEKIFPDKDHPGMIQNLFWIGFIEQKENTLNEARQSYERALAILEEEPNDVWSVRLQRMLGTVYRDLGQFDASERALKRALIISERSAEIPAKNIASILDQLASTYRASGREDDAAEFERRAMNTREAVE